MLPPEPGSDEAQEAGCTCPRDQPQRAWGLYTMVFGCPTHDDACVVCGAGPRGRCDPPDEYVDDCPHGCSPER